MLLGKNMIFSVVCAIAKRSNCKIGAAAKQSGSWIFQSRYMLFYYYTRLPVDLGRGVQQDFAQSRLYTV